MEKRQDKNIHLTHTKGFFLVPDISGVNMHVKMTMMVWSLITRKPEVPQLNTKMKCP